VRPKQTQPSKKRLTGRRERRASVTQDIVTESRFHIDAFRRVMTSNAPSSLVQGWTGFSPAKDIAGGHDAPSRERGAHRRRRRQAFARGAPSRDVGLDARPQLVATVVTAEASPEGHRHAGYAQQPHSCVNHPSNQTTCRRSASLCRAHPPTERQSRHRLPPSAEHSPSTLLTFARHRQTHAPPWAPPPALGAPNLAYRAPDPAPPADAAVSILTIAANTVLASPSPEL
jgi:hypothetical protein